AVSHLSLHDALPILRPPCGAATAGHGDQGMLQELHARPARYVYQDGGDGVAGAPQIVKREKENDDGPTCDGLFGTAPRRAGTWSDRKSTRLNSSHSQ